MICSTLIIYKYYQENQSNKKFNVIIYIFVLAILLNIFVDKGLCVQTSGTGRERISDFDWSGIDSGPAKGIFVKENEQQSYVDKFGVVSKIRGEEKILYLGYNELVNFMGKFHPPLQPLDTTPLMYSKNIILLTLKNFLNLLY